MPDQYVKGGGFGTVERGLINEQPVCIKRPLVAKVIDWDYCGEPVYAEQSELDALFEQEKTGNRLVQKLGKQDYLMEVREVKTNAILLGWVEGCTLNEYIKETRKRGEIPTFEARKTLLAEILYGLRTLHTRRLAHDLSADNFMIKEGTHELVPKVYSSDPSYNDLSHNDLSADNIMIRKGTLEPVLIDYSMVRPREATDIEAQADLGASYFGRGFRFVATMVFNWIPWENISAVHQWGKSIVKVNHFSGDPPPLNFDEKEKELLNKLTGPDNLEEPTHPTCFEEIEDLLI